jgi:type IV pilus assembly protein PilB
MMELNNVLRELAFKRCPLTELRKAARTSGMRPLLEDGRIKIRNGITTADELVKIAQIQELVSE